MADADAYARARKALAEPDSGVLGLALQRAAAVPLTIAECAADVADLAALVADRADPEARADAAAAALLAAGAAQAAAHLVKINLGVLSDDERAQQADAAVDGSRRAAQRALASV
jgi:formiminotetrahydrofolate cyclodeaminase